MSGDATTMKMEQHLLFHKSMINDSVSSEKIDRYLKVLGEEKDHERLQDDTDESIRTVFRLVLEGDFDPWAIDLRQFVRLYTKKVTMSKFDIIVAGKLMLMAWKVLRLQSDETKKESDRNYEVEDLFEFDDSWDFDAMGDVESLSVPNIQLKGLYTRTPTRPVSMVELLDAFDEARQQMEIAEERERTRQRLKEMEPKKFDNMAHREIDDSDVKLVWERIQKIGTGAFPLSDLYTADMDNNITVFWSALQLVRDGKLAIWQDDLPYGEIMIDIKVDWSSGKLEDAEESIKVAEAVM